MLSTRGNPRCPRPRNGLAETQTVITAASDRASPGHGEGSRIREEDDGDQVKVESRLGATGRESCEVREGEWRKSDLLEWGMNPVSLQRLCSATANGETF